MDVLMCFSFEHATKQNDFFSITSATFTVDKVLVHRASERFNIFGPI